MRRWMGTCGLCCGSWRTDGGTEGLRRVLKRLRRARAIALASQIFGFALGIGVVCSRAAADCLPGASRDPGGHGDRMRTLAVSQSVQSGQSEAQILEGSGQGKGALSCLIRQIVAAFQFGPNFRTNLLLIQPKRFAGPLLPILRDIPQVTCWPDRTSSVASKISKRPRS